MFQRELVQWLENQVQDSHLDTALERTNFTAGNSPPSVIAGASEGNLLSLPLFRCFLSNYLTHRLQRRHSYKFTSYA